MAHIIAQFNENRLKFKTSLDRIVEKYSKIKHDDGGKEVDLGSTKIRTLAKYMEDSTEMLETMESKSLTDLNEESLSGPNVTGNSQLDLTYDDDDGADRTLLNSTSSFAELKQSSLDESCRDLSESELLPEDQNEELQMSLNSHGNSLLELYPSMVSRIERACHRQHVSEAASSVLRRYQKWRQRPKRDIFNSTFNVSSKLQLKESSKSPVRRLETTPRRALQTVPSLHDGQTGNYVPSIRRPIRVMDFSQTTQPREISLNDTILSGMLPRKQLPLEERVSKFPTGLSPPSYGTSSSSKDPFLYLTKPPVPSHSAESTYSRESPAVTKRPDVYSSPIRQSPFRAKMINAFSRSPQAFSRDPQEYTVERSSRESVRPRSLSASLPSSPKTPVVQLRMLYPPSSQPQPARRPDGRNRLRRHLSFDSSLPRTASYSPKKVDEDFVKLYHKLVCQNKSVFFNSHPCRLCSRSSKVSRGHSSSSLAALALSPHRSVLWKRHREMGSDSYPQSKRHKTEMPRCCLSPSTGAFAYSPGKHRTQQPAARQESWMRWHQRVSAEESYVLGDSREITTIRDFSRK
ncbi:uncharacterized protein si:dkeyp-117h8.4 isoform X2 [Kryptolebias marmoratus]|uniref:uncharacterized protein si:dkeyp-117h8.4 isoform X2 n=1 Tax=Kryptolebias marmoratus TaxID=37003 RepID=UPI0007F8A6D4|nr:uncharacterized protein si:dkeyp-117h8.4 isoform X2 [Kryptolebias marmoratus]